MIEIYKTIVHEKLDDAISEYTIFFKYYPIIFVNNVILDYYITPFLNIYNI